MKQRQDRVSRYGSSSTTHDTIRPSPSSSGPHSSVYTHSASTLPQRSDFAMFTPSPPPSSSSSYTPSSDASNNSLRRRAAPHISTQDPNYNSNNSNSAMRHPSSSSSHPQQRQQQQQRSRYFQDEHYKSAQSIEASINQMGALFTQMSSLVLGM